MLSSILGWHLIVQFESKLYRSSLLNASREQSPCFALPRTLPLSYANPCLRVNQQQSGNDTRLISSHCWIEKEGCGNQNECQMFQEEMEAGIIETNGRIDTNTQQSKLAVQQGRQIKLGTLPPASDRLSQLHLEQGLFKQSMRAQSTSPAKWRSIPRYSQVKRYPKTQLTRDQPPTLEPMDSKAHAGMPQSCRQLNPLNQSGWPPGLSSRSKLGANLKGQVDQAWFLICLKYVMMSPHTSLIKNLFILRYHNTKILTSLKQCSPTL